MVILIISQVKIIIKLSYYKRYGFLVALFISNLTYTTFFNFLMEMEINYSIFSNFSTIKRMDVIKTLICYHLDIWDIMRLVIPLLSYLSLPEWSWVYSSRTFTICPTLVINPTQDDYCPISNIGCTINGFVLLVKLSVKRLLNTGMY